MKCLFMGAAAVLVSASLTAAEPKEEVQNAVKALAEKDNYSWTTKSDISRDTESFQTEATGMSEKEGFTHVTMPIRNNNIEIVMKGEKGAVRTQEGWRSFAELQSGNNNNNQNQGRGMARFLRAARGPAVEAADLADKVQNLTKSDNEFSGELTEEAAKEMLSFGRGGGNVQVSNAKGKATFAIMDGVLSKLTYEVEGTVSRDGNTTNVKRRSETEVRDIGTTKVVIPDEAKTKAST